MRSQSTTIHPRSSLPRGRRCWSRSTAEPVWRQVEGTNYERLLNTRPLLLRDSSANLYLHLFDGWLEAQTLEGPWQVAGAAPSGSKRRQRRRSRNSPPIFSMVASPTSRRWTNRANRSRSRPWPRARFPTLSWPPSRPSSWSRMAAPSGPRFRRPGSSSPRTRAAIVFRQASGSSYYVLLSGRWFEGPSLDGPWSFVPQGELAEDFRQIPDDSPKENVKASIAGTPQAQEAVIANSVPQTSEIDRQGAEFTPMIDGEPKWQPIESTSLAYVENSPTPILRVAPDQYYAVNNGVWFVAPAVTGPWIAAVQVPEVIYTIPTSSPLHYVTYVRVYDSDEETVVVGYTPGYYGTAVSGDVVVYGTGYAYDPVDRQLLVRLPLDLGLRQSALPTPPGVAGPSPSESAGRGATGAAGTHPTTRPTGEPTGATIPGMAVL